MNLYTPDFLISLILKEFITKYFYCEYAECIALSIDLTSWSDGQ